MTSGSLADSLFGAAEGLAAPDRRARLAALAEQLRAFRRPVVGRCVSGWPRLDEAVGGGFVVPGVHELVATTIGSPARTVALRVAASAAAQRGWILYIDVDDDFYPPAAARMGVPLDRLLVVRAARRLDALWVCEQSLRCGAVAATVLTSSHVEPPASRRLQLAAETGGSLGLLIQTADRGGHTFASTRLRFEPLAGGLEGRRVRVWVLKVREGKPAAPFELELRDAKGHVSAHALSPNGPRAAVRRLAAG